MKNLLIIVAVAIVTTALSLWLISIMIMPVVEHLELEITHPQTLAMLTITQILVMLIKQPSDEKHQNLEKAVFSTLETVFRDVMGIGIVVVSFLILISLL
jgi:hypothetical protein